MESDVIVIGAGGAGMMAAIAAADTGAKVLHLEKMPTIGGCWADRGGTFTGAQTKMQFRAGIYNDSPHIFYSDLMHWQSTRQYSQPEVLRFYSEHAGEAVDWLDSLGAFVPPMDKPFPGQYGDAWTVLRSYGIRGPILRFILPQYQKRIDRGDVTLLTSTTVTSLIQKGGRVIGVRAKGESGMEGDYQSGAVIVCTGGFGSNPELVKRNLPEASHIITHTPVYAK